MARNDVRLAADPFGAGEPKWPTATRRLTRDGRLVGASPASGVWLYKKVPLSAMTDAKTTAERLASASPLLAALEAVNNLTSLRGGNRRAMVKNAYRQVHILMLNVPQHFEPPHRHHTADQLRTDYGERLVESRLLLFGVRLKDSVIGTGGWRGAVDSIVETLTTGGTPLADFDKDFAQVDRALTQVGLTAVSQADIRFADSWFNGGISPDPIMRADMDNLAVFSSPETARHAREHWNDQQVASWPDDPGYHVLSMAAVQDIELDWVGADTRRAMWAADLLDSNAAVISIRAQVEPAAVTRKEVEAKEKGVAADINERYKANKITKAEQDRQLAELRAIHGMYGTDGAPPTLVDTSIVVGFRGLVERVEDLLPVSSAVTLNPMSNRQLAALAETWVCSNVRANPHLLDLPSTTVGFSGLTEQSKVGDTPTPWAALVGFTERDRQPAWWDHRAAHANDLGPLFLGAGATGSGKSVFALHIADQVARAGAPVVFIDPKLGSDHSDAVRNSNGQVVSLDDLLSADGVFDPLRWGVNPEVSIEQAANMLLSVNPWGDRRAEFEVPINSALAYGVAQGAKCIGQALQLALRDGKVGDRWMVDRVLELADAVPLFRAQCGVNPQSEALRIADGITYIRVGNANLALPEPGATEMNLTQRVSVNLVRLMVSGSATALTDRNGLVIFDEAWVFFDAGNTQLERLARVARSQTVTVLMLTQRVSDATLSGINEHISGGFILPLKEEEAKVACQILGLEPTQERLSRITAKATLGSDDSADEARKPPNWHSMRALHEWRDGRKVVVRGTVALYADIHNRVVPVEVTIAPSFLAKASTNRADIDARKRAAATA